MPMLPCPRHHLRDAQARAIHSTVCASARCLLQHSAPAPPSAVGTLLSALYTLSRLRTKDPGGTYLHTLLNRSHPTLSTQPELHRRVVWDCVLPRASRRRRRPHAGPRAADDRPAPQPFPALVHALIITRRAPSYSPPNAPRQQKPNGECTGLPFFPRGATRRIGLQSHAITRRSPGGAAGSLPCSQAAASRPPALQGLQRPRLRRVSLGGVSRRCL